MEKIHWIDTSKLNGEERQRLWALLEERSPEAIEWITSDFVQAVRKHFDAAIIIPDPRTDEERAQALAQAQAARLQKMKAANVRAGSER